MRRSLKRVSAVALLALTSSWVVGVGVAFHLATDDHHGDESAGHHDELDLAAVVHGHAHRDGTPDHGHPFAGGIAAPLPGKQLLLIGVMIGDAPEVVDGTSPHRPLLSLSGATRDPPPRLAAVPVLRI